MKTCISLGTQYSHEKKWLTLQVTFPNVSTVKPIFHQNANSLVLGHCVGPLVQCETFALPILTCWYPKTLVHSMQTLAHPNQPKVGSNVRCWNCSRWARSRRNRIGHINFILFVLFSFALVTQHKHGFWWKMDLTVLDILGETSISYFTAFFTFSLGIRPQDCRQEWCLHIFFDSYFSFVFIENGKK